MDESFLLRARRLLRHGRPVDCGALIAAVAARQEATPTASAARRPLGRDTERWSAVAEIILADPDLIPDNRRDSVGGRRAEAGCFNRAAVRRRVNEP